MKSYNPFRMWGSYVGAILSYLFFVFIIRCPIITLFNSSCRTWQTAFLVALGYNDYHNKYTFTGLIIFIVIISIGFLVGWGVTSLFRRFVK